MPVVLAFEQLLAEGYIESRVGAGSFVARGLAALLSSTAKPATSAKSATSAKTAASAKRATPAKHPRTLPAMDDAMLETVQRDCCAPEDFYSTTNHKTWVRNGGHWLDAENQRMDAMVVVKDGRAFCRRLRDLRKGDQVVVGMRGIRVMPEAKERDRDSFAFMSNEISSERQLKTAIRQIADVDA